MSKCDEQPRIEGLALRRVIQGLDPDQAAALEGHLATCAECTRATDRLAAGLGALRSVSVVAPPWLAAATARSLEARFEERREARQQAWLIGGAAVAAFGLGAVSTAALWASLGTLGLPEAPRLLVMAFAWSWPPTAAVLAVALGRPADGLHPMWSDDDA